MKQTLLRFSPLAFARRVARLWPHERRCLACASLCSPQGSANGLFCADCLSAMPRRERGYCPSCGEPAPWPEMPLSLCARCLEKRPPWSRFLFHGLYEGPLRCLLLALKFGDQVIYGHALGMLLARHPDFATIDVDAVIPVPLHEKRLRQRGYNQAHEIARPIAAQLGVPLYDGHLVRIKATAPQSGSSLEQRRLNIQGAFVCVKKGPGKRFLLVDDTVTTGSTLEAAGRALLDGGAEAVGVAVVSRTPRYRHMLLSPHH